MFFGPVPGSLADAPTPVAARRRALLTLGAVGLGLALARALGEHGVGIMTVAGVAAALAGLLASLCFVLRGRWACACLLAACVAGAAGWYQIRAGGGPGAATELERVFHEASAQARAIGGDDAARVLVRGVAMDDERVVEPAGELGALGFDSHRTRFRLNVHDVREGERWRRARGVVWVSRRFASAPDRADLVRGGTWVEASGEALTVRGPVNPGAKDLRPWCRERGIAGTLLRAIVADERAIVEREAQHGALDEGFASQADIDGRESTRAWLESTWRGAIASLRRGAIDVMEGALTEETRDGELQAERHGMVRGLMLGLVLGASSGGTDEVSEAFTRIGLAHALSISGFHLVVLAWVALGVVRLAGDRGWIQPLLIGCAVVVYLAIVPAQTPVLRAAALVLIVLASEASGRRYDALTLVLWLWTLALLWRPTDAWDLGAQLSFGMTALLLWQGASFRDRLLGVALRTGREPFEPTVLSRAMDGVRSLVATSVMCWAAALPLIAHHLGVVNVIGAVASIVLMPVLTLVLGLGFAVLVAGAVWDAAGHVLAEIAAGPTKLAIDAALWMDALPWSSMGVPQISGIEAMVLTGLVLALVAWWPCSLRRERVRVGVLLAMSVAVVGGGAAWPGLFGKPVPPRERVRVDMLDVGDGTCVLVRSGSGSGEDAVLWDCGSQNTGRGVRMIPMACRSLGAWRVATIVVTHPDLDHYSAVLDAAPQLGVRRVLVGDRFLAQAEARPEGGAAALIKGLQARGISVVRVGAGDSARVGRATIEFVGPPNGVAWEQDNEHSLAARVTPAGGWRSVLLTGDVQGAGLASLSDTVLAWAPGTVAVLELPHHGSARGDAIEFVKGLQPDVVMQSTGRKRSMDDRWDELRRSALWWETASHGAAWAEVFPDGRVRTGAAWKSQP
ncbi:MAG: ComEC/Rec2 family competence protein [Planctomycetota bacterium]|nr:ComEC/Rec2 family competence protein [Planctomycetota bacterium]